MKDFFLVFKSRAVVLGFWKRKGSCIVLYNPIVQQGSLFSSMMDYVYSIECLHNVYIDKIRTLYHIICRAK